MSRPNVDHVCIGQVGPGDGLPPDLSSASNLVIAVVLVCAHQKVPGVHARRVVANMPDELSIRHRPHENLVGHDMGTGGLVSDAYLPIAVLISTAAPLPAIATSRRITRHMPPEGFLHGRPMKAIPSTFRVAVLLPTPIVLVAPAPAIDGVVADSAGGHLAFPQVCQSLIFSSRRMKAVISSRNVLAVDQR